jgi:hypothetical protein
MKEDEMNRTCSMVEGLEMCLSEDNIKLEKYDIG